MTALKEFKNGAETRPVSEGDVDAIQELLRAVSLGKTTLPTHAKALTSLAQTLEQLLRKWETEIATSKLLTAAQEAQATGEIGGLWTLWQSTQEKSLKDLDLTCMSDAMSTCVAYIKAKLEATINQVASSGEVPQKSECDIAVQWRLLAGDFCKASRKRAKKWVLPEISF